MVALSPLFSFGVGIKILTKSLFCVIITQEVKVEWLDNMSKFLVRY